MYVRQYLVCCRRIRLHSGINLYVYVPTNAKQRGRTDVLLVSLLPCHVFSKNLGNKVALYCPDIYFIVQIFTLLPRYFTLLPRYLLYCPDFINIFFSLFFIFEASRVAGIIFLSLDKGDQA
jgi:hypothetical protein